MSKFKMKKEGPNLLSISSAFILLIAPLYFGYHEQSTEMGLAILAGTLGLAFGNLDKLSEFSGAGFSAKMKEQVTAVIEKETETSDVSKMSQQVDSLNMKILKALLKENYTWRTMSGIVSDASCTEDVAWSKLVELIQRGLVRYTTKSGSAEEIWALTEKGRQFVLANT